MVKEKIGKYKCICICDKCNNEYSGNYYYNIKKDEHLCRSCFRKRQWENPEYRKLKSKQAIKQNKKMWKDGKLKEKHRKLTSKGTKKVLSNPIIREKMRKSSLKKWNNPEYKNKIVKERIERWNNQDFYNKWYKKFNKTLVKKSGFDLRSVETEWSLYKRIIANQTNRIYRKYKDIINPNDLIRGRSQYHLDHKFSIFEGFKNNIPPYIISHYTNLEMLSEHDNISKRIKCSITMDELFKGGLTG